MNTCITDYLHDSLLKFENKIVYKDEEKEVTFKQLDMLSLSIATYLCKKDFFEKPVLVMTSRNVMAPVSHIGIARAGCHYVPMDVTNPISRLNQIVDITKAELMIVDKKNYSLAESLIFRGEIVLIEDILLTAADRELVNGIEKRITDTMPLYVIFTSGSTGVPKGVTTSHHAVMSYIEDVVDVMGITENDILGNQSPMDYIAAVRDIYIPIKTGAMTYIIPNNVFAIPDALLKILNDNKVSTICWSAAGLELCVKTGLFKCGIPSQINKVLFSGSVISGKALSIWQTNLPKALFVNQYGPTEATASCTYYIVKETVKENSVIPIGKPFKNYKIILLDENNNKVINSEKGEICVSGPTVSLGYYNNVTATQKAFVQNPTNKAYREIIYKTGDYGKIDEHGNYVFCGRMDRQIKYMGHRIELEEIEIFGKNISGIDECVALFDQRKEMIVLIYTGTFSTRDITLLFRKELPAYMVPRKIVNVEEMKKLPNGKLNIKEMEKEYIEWTD